MAERGIAARNPVNRAIYQFFAQDRDNAGQGPHPAQALGAERCRAPALALGPGKVADDLWYCFLKHTHHWSPGNKIIKKVDTVPIDQVFTRDRKSKRLNSSH